MPWPPAAFDIATHPIPAAFSAERCRDRPPLARFEVIEDGFGRKRAASYPSNPRPNNKYRHGDGNELSAIARPSPLEFALPESPLLHDRLCTDNQQLERVRGMGTAIINGIHAQERFLRVPPARGTMVGSLAMAEHRQHRLEGLGAPR